MQIKPIWTKEKDRSPESKGTCLYLSSQEYDKLLKDKRLNHYTSQWQ